MNERDVRLPQGTRDLLPVAAAARHRLVEALLGEAAGWGYRRIETPPFEYEAVLARGLGRTARAEAVRFVEAQTGEVVALRPDITPQIARLVATRFPSVKGPLRLCYAGSVVRRGTGHRYGGSDAQRVLDQVGVELAHARAPSGDVEVLALAGAALERAGLERFTIDLTEASFVRAAFDGLPPDEAASLERAVGRKDRAEVARLVAGLRIAPARRRLLVALPSLYGGVEVLAEARRLVAGLGARGVGRTTREALDALADVVARLGALDEEWPARLSLDLGEVRGFDYYTGLRFQGFADGAGDAILSGGRYDRLIERYGRTAPAAGFAVDVERLALALAAAGVAPLSPPALGVLVVAAGRDDGRALALARALRRVADGAPVVTSLANRPDRADCAEAAGRATRTGDSALVAEARALGLARVIVVGDGSARWHLVGRPAPAPGDGGDASDEDAPNDLPRGLPRGLPGGLPDDLPIPTRGRRSQRREDEPDDDALGPATARPPRGAPLDTLALARFIADPLAPAARALARTLLGQAQLRRRTPSGSAGRRRRSRVR